ncbi:MAG TPA: hypothetical protein VFZ46_02395 [Nitrososphaeraceae archaeon]
MENCNNKIGKILEIFVSKKMNNNKNSNKNKKTLMILVDINEVILLASLSVDREKPDKASLKGNLVRIKKCGFIDNKIFYEFKILNKFN